MKKPLHYVTAGTLLLSLTLGLGGGASAETAGNTASTVEAVPASITVAADNGDAKPVFMYRFGHSGLLQSESHDRHYLKLLAKVYAPESEAAWSAALEERKRVEQQFPKPAVTRAEASTEAVKIQKLDKDALQQVTEDKEMRYIKLLLILMYRCLLLLH